MVENLKLRDGQEGIKAFLQKKKPSWTHNWLSLAVVRVYTIFNCVGFALLHYALWLVKKNSRHSLNQSDVKPNSIGARSLTFPALRAMFELYDLIHSSWYSLVLFGRCDNWEKVGVVRQSSVILQQSKEKGTLSSRRILIVCSRELTFKVLHLRARLFI